MFFFQTIALFDIFRIKIYQTLAHATQKSHPSTYSVKDEPHSENGTF